METTALQLMNEYIHDNMDCIQDEKFTNNMIMEVFQLMESQFGEVDEECIVQALLMCKGRICYSCPPSDCTAQLEVLRAKPQPEQRTPEWYVYRSQLITASSAYKALGSDAKLRELAKDKIHTESSEVSLEGPLHWGVKYEPVSLQYYCYFNRTKVEEFGCITHTRLTFLGASPDGINVDPSSLLYGRMVEIKNPFSRIITGNPKKEYWIQCQIQMEVCDLDYCDFLETSFKEYENEEQFNSDGTFEQTENGQYKGIIEQYYVDKIGYAYPPFQCSREEYEVWRESVHGWLRTIYWRLETVSCVIIPRHKEWFERVEPRLVQSYQSIQTMKSVNPDKSILQV